MQHRIQSNQTHEEMLLFIYYQILHDLFSFAIKALIKTNKNCIRALSTDPFSSNGLVRLSQSAVISTLTICCNRSRTEDSDSARWISIALLFIPPSFIPPKLGCGSKGSFRCPDRHVATTGGPSFSLNTSQ